MKRAKRIFLFLFLSLPASPFSVPDSLPAQSLASLPSDVLKDEPRIWASPFHLHSSDAKWLLPFAAGTAGLLITDHAVSEDAHESPGLLTPSRKISNLGGGLALTSAALGFYGTGKLTHNSHVAKTGLLAGQSIIHSTLITAGLKAGFNRERPDKILGNGAFWEGGRSFPSGHAAATWSFATVVAQEYRNKPIVGAGAYGVATVVSLARVGGLNHYSSDVLVGAVIGNLVGRFVLHRRAHN